MTHLIQVGNSLGVRIPKAILAQVGFKKEVELVFKVTEQGLLLCPSRSVREGWEEAFKTPKKASKEPLLLESALSNVFDEDEWQW